MSPFFSIILPTYERPSAVLKIVSGLQQQIFQDWELIIIDDSIQSISTSIEALKDQRISYYHTGKRQGVSFARNYGVELSKGPYVVFIDDDDAVTPQWLLDFEKSILDHESDAVFCSIEVHNHPDSTVKIESPKIKFKGSAHSIHFLAGCFCIRKDLFLKAGGYDTSIYFAESTEFFLRLESFFYTSSVVRKPNFIYQSSLDGGSKNLVRKAESLALILKKHAAYFQNDFVNKSKYFEILGVTNMRLQQFGAARKFFFKSIGSHFFSYSTLKNVVRILQTFFPILYKWQQPGKAKFFVKSFIIN
jgi:glycosyltransferase involved in cell wall biosynthesis